MDKDSALYFVILEEMNSDMEIPWKIQARLLKLYEDSNEQQRKIIDDIFMDLTGWTFPTLKEKAGLS